MNSSEIIRQTSGYVQNRFENEGSGHDWWHICRVCRLAKIIAASEGGDLFIIEMAALLHDLDDYKLNHNGSSNLAGEWLARVIPDDEIAGLILNAIEQVSFRGANVGTPAATIEAKIVQDADRLDAIGAIGIARAFSYGGSRNRPIYDPDSLPVMYGNFEDYKNNNTATINHFYEKLLLLKDRMQTKTGLELALKRHYFLEEFLKQFFMEWEGKN